MRYQDFMPPPPVGEAYPGGGILPDLRLRVILSPSQDLQKRLSAAEYFIRLPAFT